jgi:large subunit ribosomal protein L10
VIKSEKEELIKELNEKFSRAQTAIVAEFSKLNVETVTKLRKKFREGKVDYKVLKNTLAKRAAKGTPVEVIAEDFVGPVAIAISYDDVVAPAKILVDFIKDLETIKVRSASVQGRRIDTEGSSGPSRPPAPSWPACSRPTWTSSPSNRFEKQTHTQPLAFSFQMEARPLEVERRTLKWLT